MPTYIEISEANLRNIAIFPDEPDDTLIDEIKGHVRLTASPHTWRGHSHTKPPQGAFPVYVDEFDVPAPDTVPRVAPCPCCNPNHPQYKNKGKIAWFPNEWVIRLIGPQCFKTINGAGHELALIDLRKRQKRRDELATIAHHRHALHPSIDALSEAIAIAEALDDFQREINRVLDSELHLNLWREVKGGDLNTTETRRVPFRKADGTMGERSEEFRVPFGRIAGYSMIDRSGQMSAGKLGPLRAGLIKIAERLDEAGTAESLTDAERESIAASLVKGRTAAAEVLAGMQDRQLFLTSRAIEELGRWGQHPNAPVRFSITRRKTGEVVLSGIRRTWGAPAIHTVYVGYDATKPVPGLPALMRH